MCVVKDMYVYRLVLFVQALWSVSSVDINMAGDVEFDLSVVDEWSPRGRDVLEAPGKGHSQGHRQQLNNKHQEVNKTTACIYQLPKTKQVNEIVSNMMNVLTKIFMRTRELCAEKPPHRLRARRPPSLRFRIVGAKNTSYFDQIYSNMTQEFKSFYRGASGRLPRPRAGDACGHQAEARLFWRRVLTQVQDTLRSAATQLIHQQLKSVDRPHAALRRRLDALVAREVSRLRERQLDALCQRREQCRTGLS